MMEEEDIKIERISGETVFIVDAKWPEESADVTDKQLGIRSSELQKYCTRGQVSLIAQFYKLVIPGTILTRHIFEGLNRPLYCDNNESGDQGKLVYSRKPAYDYIWEGGRSGRPVEKKVDPGKVFIVIVSPNIRHKNKFPSIAGWIERWNWVIEDDGLPEAPDKWVDRYNKKIYTRGGN